LDHAMQCFWLCNKFLPFVEFLKAENETYRCKSALYQIFLIVTLQIGPLLKYPRKHTCFNDYLKMGFLPEKVVKISHGALASNTVLMAP